MNLFSRLFAPKKHRPMISQARLHSLLSEQIRMASNCKIRFADSQYGCVDKEEAFTFARNTASIYIPELNDCEDAAWLFKAEAIKQARKRGEKYPLAAGVVWLPSHALGCCVDQYGRVWIFDYDQRILEPSELAEQATLILL